MSLCLKFSGFVHVLEATTSKEFGTNTFFQRNVVVEVPGRYPQFIPLQAKGNTCSLLDGFNVGDEITVDVEVGGREWKKKDKDGNPTGEVGYFPSLEVFRVAKGTNAPAAAPAQQQAISDDVPF